MYNVKIFKYPTGYQIRTYSSPVGFCDTDKQGLVEPLEVGAMVFDEESQEYTMTRFNPSLYAVEPFGDTLAKRMPEDKLSGPERSARNSMCRTVNKVYSLSRSNLWDWFVTLTFDPQKVNSFDYDSCVKALSNWLIVQRRKCPDLKYIMVPELHKSGRWHFHGLMAECDGITFTDSGHCTPSGDAIYNVDSYRLGFSTATRVHDNERVTKYISKYITKELCAVTTGRKRYWASRNLAECEMEEYLLEGAELKEYMNFLMVQCKHNKTIGHDLKVSYFEMGVCE